VRVGKALAAELCFFQKKFKCDGFRHNLH
jgi:hypothetical protein